MSSIAAASRFDPFRRKLLKTALFAAPAILAGGGGASDVGKGSKTLRVAVTLPNAVEKFDPNKSFMSTYDIVLNPLFDKLMSFDRHGGRMLLAAKSIDYAPDGMSMRIAVNDGVFWSYGEPVVAGDYVRGLQRASMADSDAIHLMRNIENSDKWAAGDYSQPLGIEAPDDRTITFSLSKPFGFDLINLVNMQANPYPPDGRNPGPLLATNGPYMLEALEKEIISLVRNPYYRGTKPYFDRIEFTGFSDNVAIDYFISGKADVLLGPTGKQKKWLLSHYKNGAMETGLPRQYGIIFAAPTADSPAALKDAEFRRALFISLDRDSFEQSGVFFKSDVHCGLIPDAMPCGEDRKRMWQAGGTMDERVQRAEKIVRRMGYTPEKPLRLTLVVASSIRGFSEIGGFVKSSWHEIGVEVDLIDIPVFGDAIDAMKTGKYNMMINSFYQLAPYQYVYRPEVLGNWTFSYGPLSADLDRLILQMSRSTGAEHSALVLQAEHRMMEQMTSIPVASDTQIGFYADWLSPNQDNMPKIALRYFTAK